MDGLRVCHFWLRPSYPGWMNTVESNHPLLGQFTVAVVLSLPFQKRSDLPDLFVIGFLRWPASVILEVLL